MAKHRFQRTRKMPKGRLLLLAVLVCGLGTVPSWAAEQPAKSSLQNAKNTQAAGHKRARTTTARPSQPPVRRKGATSESSQLSAGKRDPFKLPETSAGKGSGENIREYALPGGVLPQGIRGLLVSHLQLEGVVREHTSNKMIAVVTNESKRAYFLNEGDTVYNGVVSKITPDAVYFKENVLDPNGKVWTRDVMKRLGSAPGEGR
jgi:hypothetical protein